MDKNVGLCLYISKKIKRPIIFQTLNNFRACLTRVLKYVIPVFILSVAFNTPKFMEAEIKVDTNRTDQPNGAYIDLSDMRKNPEYTFYYNNWAR